VEKIELTKEMGGVPPQHDGWMRWAMKRAKQDYLFVGQAILFLFLALGVEKRRVHFGLLSFFTNTC